jgi:two-component system chemotaxis response regulator CheB
MKARPPYKAAVIGASAGALDALSAILPGLPAAYPLPVMVVVHIPPDKESVLAGVVGAKALMRAKEAEDKEQIEPGVIYFAPPDYHLLVESGGYLSLSGDEPVLFSRPSVDVLFESAADAYGAGLIGIVLSGANNDGARGLKAVMDAGGTALVQRPDQAYAPAMPEAALAASPGAAAMSLDEIHAFLKNAVNP